jgi:hypothetical protein
VACLDGHFVCSGYFCALLQAIKALCVVVKNHASALCLIMEALHAHPHLVIFSVATKNWPCRPGVLIAWRKRMLIFGVSMAGNLGFWIKIRVSEGMLELFLMIFRWI